MAPLQTSVSFVRNNDGVRTAYSVLGEGPKALLYIPAWGCSNIELDMESQAGAAFFARLARNRKVIYLMRSLINEPDAPAETHSIAGQVEAVSQVLSAAGAETIDIMAMDDGCAIAVAYAARAWAGVRHLVLWAPYTHTRGSSDAAVRGLIELANRNWALTRRTFGDLNFPTGPDNLRRWFSEYHRRTASPETTARYLALAADADSREVLPKVTAPTLVLHRRGDRVIPQRSGRSTAALMPNATFMGLEGDIHLPYYGDTTFLDAVDAFLNDQPARSGTASAESAHGTAIILFTDIAESTALTEQMGDATFRTAASALDERLRTAIRDAGGTPIEGKVLGDGVMAVFASAAQAIDAAARCASLAAAAELGLHVGLHAGDVLREEGNVYGGAVNIAARICGLCDPGEVLVSQTVRDLARTSAGVAFTDRGEHALKGIPDPVRVFSIRIG